MYTQNKMVYLSIPVIRREELSDDKVEKHGLYLDSKSKNNNQESAYTCVYLLEIKDICFAYDNNLIIKNLSLKLKNKEKIGIYGSTGCGKTTLLYIIMGLLKPDCGEIILFKKNIKDISDYSKIRPKIGFMFQNSDDQLFSPTVIDDIAFGPLNLGKTKEEALIISESLLRRLNIEKLRNKITYKLSGGEKKLVALATVLAMNPKFLLLDEPLTGLDPGTRFKIKALLQEINIPIITISHDHDFLDEISQNILEFSHGALKQVV